jgi:hypothetical protein
MQKNGTKRKKGKVWQKYVCPQCGHNPDVLISKGFSPPADADTTDISGQARTLDELLQKANVDLSVWEVESFEIKDNTYEVAAKERDQDLTWTREMGEKGPVQIMEGHAKRGDWQTKQNKTFYIRVKLRRKKNLFDAEMFRRDMLATFVAGCKYVPRNEYKSSGRSCMEINIFDLHLGKFAWSPETGENYDNKIARARFFDALEYFVNMAHMFEIEEFLFPVGNDFFNSDKDYPFPSTTAGTPQESDLRWQKSFKLGREMIIQAIDFLSTIAPVRVIVVPGNHDFQKMFYLGDVLEAYYSRNENVSVDNSPRSRKYFKYGVNLIGFTHGRPSDVPESRLLLLMPQEVPQLWAETKYREWHCGDIHHKKKISVRSEEDHHGINIRYMRSLKGTDSWEYQKGYVGSIGGAEAYIWDKEQGLISIFNYNL